MLRPCALVSVAIVTSLAAPGCVFFDDDDDDTCKLTDTGETIVANELRDPATGLCQSYDWGGCSDPCAPCAEPGRADPDWASCYSACEGLAEGTCKATSGCRAIYTGSEYYACWATAPSGPVQGGGCVGLDAQNCSRHDDCVAIHTAESVDYYDFVSCAPESGTTDPGSCVGQITCAAAEPACPSGTIAGRRNGCWTGYCIPYAQCDTLPTCDTLGEAACISRTDCSPTYEGNNCTCNGQSCTCQSWTFDSCKTM